MIILGGYVVLHHKGTDANVGLNSPQDTTSSYQTNLSLEQAPANWLTYSNNKFGFNFEYPPDTHVCEIVPSTHLQEPTILELGMSIQGTDCANDRLDIYINIDNNLFEIGQTEDNKNLKEDFYRGYGGIIPSLNPNLEYMNLDGFRAFGGLVKRPTVNNRDSEYIILISQGGHNINIWDRHYNRHPEDTLRILGSMRFDPNMYKR